MTSIEEIQHRRATDALLTAFREFSDDTVVMVINDIQNYFEKVWGEPFWVLTDEELADGIIGFLNYGKSGDGEQEAL